MGVSPCIEWLQLRNLPLCPHFPRKQLFQSEIFGEKNFPFWYIFGDKLKRGNSSKGVTRNFYRLMEGCALIIWDELNFMRFCGFREWKYLGDICTLKGATDKKVVLKSFEEKGLIGLCAKFQLFQSCASCFLPIAATFLTKIGRKYFPLNLWAVFPLSQTASYGLIKIEQNLGLYFCNFRNPCLDYANTLNSNLI